MGKQEREINALITLLGDDDLKVKNIAQKKLLELGEPAQQTLRQVAFSDSDGRTRIAAQALLEGFRLERLAQDFNKINRVSDFDLESACFILAKIEYPELDIQQYVNKIDQLALETERRLYGIQGERDKVEVINHFLFDEKGFHGNEKSYYEPENSYINKVLDRQTGIPISLSAIYLFLAGRLNLPVCGVGFPGHFLLKYRSNSRPFFIDAFNSGQILSQQECEHFLRKRGYAFHPYYLNTSESRDILARMIKNLVLIYLQKNQQNKINTLVKFFSEFVINERETKI
ncbi:transglutaminase family protein [candidate division KSB1 bacterium]|nr:transglutaminase family protein [candidate division KSB1 bacterium]TDI88623.1 MAG: hypothetical protein E2O77_10990 [Caldithrix sp.]